MLITSLTGHQALLAPHAGKQKLRRLTNLPMMKKLLIALCICGMLAFVACSVAEQLHKMEQQILHPSH